MLATISLNNHHISIRIKYTIIDIATAKFICHLLYYEITIPIIKMLE